MILFIGWYRKQKINNIREIINCYEFQPWYFNYFYLGDNQINVRTRLD